MLRLRTHLNTGINLFKKKYFVRYFFHFVRNSFQFRTFVIVYKHL